MTRFFLILICFLFPLICFSKTDIPLDDEDPGYEEFPNRKKSELQTPLLLMDGKIFILEMKELPEIVDIYIEDLNVSLFHNRYWEPGNIVIFEVPQLCEGAVYSIRICIDSKSWIGTFTAQ